MTSSELNSLRDLHGELKGFFSANEGRIQSLADTLDAIDIARAEKHFGSTPQFDLEKKLRESDNFARLIRDRKGSAVITLPAFAIGRKTAVTSSAVGASTSGVLRIDRDSGIVAEAR